MLSLIPVNKQVEIIQKENVLVHSVFLIFLFSLKNKICVNTTRFYFESKIAEVEEHVESIVIYLTLS